MAAEKLRTSPSIVGAGPGGVATALEYHSKAVRGELGYLAVNRQWVSTPIGTPKPLRDNEVDRSFFVADPHAIERTGPRCPERPTKCLSRPALT